MNGVTSFESWAEIKCQQQQETFKESSDIAYAPGELARTQARNCAKDNLGPRRLNKKVDDQTKPGVSKLFTLHLSSPASRPQLNLTYGNDV